MAVTTCIHGFAPGQCLICQTLQGGGRPVKEAAPAQSRPAATPRPTPVRPDAVLTRSRAPKRSLGWRAIGVVAILAVVLLVGIWAVHLAFAALHILELVAIAVVAGWLGYRVGLYRGRHLRPDR
jgi:uncharacterized membrane protein